MNFWKRFKQLWVKERKIDFTPIEKAVEEYFDAGNHDIIALADSMNLTPRQLYFMMSTDRLRCNILPALPEKERKELTSEICARVFSYNPVLFSCTFHGKLEPYDLNELVSRLDMIRANTYAVGELDKMPEVHIDEFTTPQGERACYITFVCEEFDKLIGRVVGMTDVQQNMLMVHYGQSNPC
ncbi:hypothetical protein BIZ83_gp160 [Erwinia phage vB_EamM_ChrisDB]|uniref:hypothetical protein n=1 Tax=Erwinia phage vB_EamM_ChrisDB TaxID=1883371 RepID=UPI00081D0D5E|nr:hypothetical protein BIZ83_gp160 [Erwinia phage vB_EamM_ChrisDB]ANZ48693.1 hypothetical protein CHRISDB_131 [Erwinia phage vB_EamM_ChrisDB]